jgi:hypothetical protein
MELSDLGFLSGQLSCLQGGEGKRCPERTCYPLAVLFRHHSTDDLRSLSSPGTGGTVAVREAA